MRASAYLACLVVMVVAMGFGVPYAAIHYMTFHGLSPWIGAPLAVLAMIGAGIVAVVGLGVMEDLPLDLGSSERERLLRERIEAYRARQRAMLEELDEIVSLLREIRDVLRGVEAERH